MISKPIVHIMKRGKEKPKAYYPIFLNINGNKCVIVGGGKVALRKVKMLLECGAKVTVISPILHQDLVRLAQGKAIRLIERDYEPHARGVRVVAADHRRRAALQNPDDASFGTVVRQAVDTGDDAVAVVARSVEVRDDEAPR